MDIKPNLDNLSDKEYSKLIFKLLDNLDNEILRLDEELENPLHPLHPNVSESVESLRNTIEYCKNQVGLRKFYQMYDVDYLSKLN